MTPEDHRIAELLRSAIPKADELEPRTDLWPRLLARMAQPPPRWTAWDWLLAAAAALCAATLPSGLYYLAYAL